MKQREKYYLRTENGQLQEVSEEIYREYYRMARKERYQEERKEKHGEVSLDAIGYGVRQSREIGDIEQVFEVEWMRKYRRHVLSEEWNGLSEWDKTLLRLLYVERKKLKEAAAILGCSRGKVITHRDKVLAKMRSRFYREGIYGSSL